MQKRADTKMKNVLVTGGAGYIGSHTVWQLLLAGFQPVVVDNLSNGFKDSLPDGVPFYQIDVRNKSEFKAVFAKHKISAVIHLAGLSVLSESFEKADEYLDHNVNGTISVLELCKEFSVRNFIFSSSSTIYGNANGSQKLTEKHNIFSMSPYGESKLLSEEKIKEYTQDFDFNYLILRYFNVAGASIDLTNGPRGTGSGRVVFNVTKAAVLGHPFTVYGNDYATVDGTSVRDYIHVDDIADIHLLGLKYLLSGGQVSNSGDFSGKCQKILNCGYGEGFSVLEIIENFKKQNNVDIKVEWGPRRQGDPDYLVSDNSELVKLLNWKSRFNDPLEAICRSSYLWEKKQFFIKLPND